MARKIEYEVAARRKLLAGVNKLARAVVTTLGPKGRNVLIDNNFNTIILHDGVRVARSIILKDKFENAAAQVIRGAASQTNDVVGDGTTTSTLLAQKMIQTAFHLIDSGSNAMFIKLGMDKALKILKDELTKAAVPVKDVEDLTKITNVSAQDPEIGSKVAEAIDKVGADGVISVKEGSKVGINVDHVDGLELENGAISPYFVTDFNRMEVEIEDPLILITDMKLGSSDEIIPFLQNIVRATKNIVIIADEVDGDALTTLVKNNRDRNIVTCAVKAPGFGERKRGILEDIAVLTNGKVVSSDEGVKLENVPVDYLGKAEMFWANREKSRIIGGKGDKTDIDKRVTYLRSKAEKAEGEFDREKFLERAAALKNGIALIQVGSTTEVERKDKLERVKDAVGAARAAKEEGIVPGGGIALLRAAGALEKVLKEEKDPDIISGIKVVLEALSWPTRQILLNAGLHERVLVKIEEGTGNFGYDVVTGEYGDLIEKGIIDPVKVTKSALENAVSIAGMLITTEVVIVDEDERRSPVG